MSSIANRDMCAPRHAGRTSCGHTVVMPAVGFASGWMQCCSPGCWANIAVVCSRGVGMLASTRPHDISSGPLTFVKESGALFIVFFPSNGTSTLPVGFGALADREPKGEKR